MADMVLNKLKVVGNPSNIKLFIESGLIDGEWKISNYHPIPEELKNTISCGYDDGSIYSEWINDHVILGIKKRIKNGEIGLIVPELIPCNNRTPEMRKKLIRKYGYHNWYEWSCYNWGTKWDSFNNKILSQTQTQFIVSFDTAWDVPIKWLNKIQCDFPNLEFKILGIGHNFSKLVYTTNYISTRVINGNIDYFDTDGNPCEYDDENDIWLNSETKIPYDEEFKPIIKSNLENEF